MPLQPIPIGRNPSNLVAVPLTSSTDMHDVLAYLCTRGYSGGVNVFQQNGQPVWQMSLQANTGSLGAQIGNIGDWITVENDVLANIVPADQAPSLYHTL